MNRFEKVRVRRLSFPFEIRHLPADPSTGGPRGSGKLCYQACSAIPWNRELRQHLKRQSEQRIAGQDRHRIAENLVVGELAAPVVVVVERGQVVMNQGVRVNQFQATRARRYTVS